MQVTLTKWGDDDLPVLQRANAPEQTRFLGGPETDDQVRDRHEKYLRFWRTGEGWTYRIDVDGVPAGSIGYWPVEHDGAPAYETGWGVDGVWQGKGVAKAALRALIAVIVADGDRDLLVAYPGVENVASNALCRGAGFTRDGTPKTMPWRGGELTFQAWALDIGALRRAR